MFRYATTATRTLTRQAQPIAPRAFSTSLRAALPTQGGVAPTISSSSTGTDRGASQVADAQEGKTSPSLNRADQTTNTSASADVNSQPDPNHPQNPAHTAGEDGQGHIPSHTRGAVGANKDGIAGGGNPLKPGAAGRGFHTSARVGASSKPVEEQSAQHPGKSDIDHLENPSLSEEVVHADRTAPDPLPAHKKASAGVGETTLGAADGVKKAADKASSAADDIAGSAGATLKKAAEAVKDTINSVTGGGKRTFSTSAISREDKRVDDGGKPAQHLESSGHDHLEKPSVSEEAAHADRSSKDPLPDSKKASQKSKADQSAGVKSNVREAQKKPVDDLPDGESTLRSIGGGSN